MNPFLWFAGAWMGGVMWSFVEHMEPTFNEIVQLYISDAQRVKMCDSASIVEHFGVACEAAKVRQSLWGVLYYPGNFLGAMGGKLHWTGPKLPEIVPKGTIYLVLLVAALPSVVAIVKWWSPGQVRVRARKREIMDE